jgi:asparagine synthase (glutamine-hydrolysing)
LLSGGLDSSAITAVAAQRYQEKNRTLPTFSVDYVDNQKYFQANDFQPNPDAPWVEKMSSI